MERVNFCSLWSLEANWDRSAIEGAFNEYLKRLSEYIGVPSVIKTVSVEIINCPYPDRITHENIFVCWVKREFVNDRFVLKIYKECDKNLPFVLLRELYACFLPETIREYLSVQLVVFYVVLEDASFVKKDSSNWNKFVDSRRSHSDTMDDDQEQINKYFRNQVHHKKLMKTFFSYLERNESIIKPDGHDFASVLFRVYDDYTRLFLSRRDNLEMLRVTFDIFSKKKTYTSAKDYEEIFEQFTSTGQIDSYLSKSAYATLFKELKNTIIAPTYKSSWSYFGAVLYFGWIRFNPLLKKTSILKVLRQIEFVFLKLTNYASFGSEFIISAFFPKIYEEDFLKFFTHLKKLGYVVDFFLSKIESDWNIYNLNAFKDFYSENALIDLQNPDFDKKLLLKAKRVIELQNPTTIPLSVMDFLLMDHLRMFSVEGTAFDEGRNRLQTYKEGLQRYKQKVNSSNKNLKDHFNAVINNPKVKEFFVSFVNKHKVYGFFYVLELLRNLNTIAKALKNLDRSNNGKEGKSQIEEALNRGTAFPQLKNNLILTNIAIKNHVKEELLPLYFQEREKFETITKKYYDASELLSSCSNLQLYDLNRILQSIINEDIYQDILEVREQKQLEYYDKLKKEDITMSLINTKLANYLKERAMSPTVTNTIRPQYATEIKVIVRYTEANWGKQLELSSFMQVIYFHKIIQTDNTPHIYISLNMSYLTPAERYSLISIIYNSFKVGDVLYLKVIRGWKLLPFITLRKYYDFPEEKYFYAKDLFSNLLFLAKKEFGKIKTPLTETPSTLWPHLLSKDRSMQTLVEKTLKRSKVKMPYDLSTFQNLKIFAKTIDQSFRRLESFNQIKNKPFFNNHVKFIKFLPVFSRFGLSQYHLYFYPVNADQINFKLLLNNSFQSLKCSVGVGVAPSFLIKYITPYRVPNMRYVNRATKTLRNVREYCVFRFTRAYFNFHAKNHFTSEGWQINPNEFEIHAQHVLFQEKWQKPPEYLNDKNLEVVTSTVFGPDSEEFSKLQRIYSRKPVDLKKNMFFRNDSNLKDFSYLFSKNLVHPQVKFKNLGLHEKIRFILPNISERVSEKLLRIFSFFPCCEAYKIEGKLYVQGLENEVEFDNGLYVKLYLPGQNTKSGGNFDSIGTILSVLEETFEVLEINHYVILDNVLKPESFLDYVFGGNVDFNGYNPLLNLKWDKKNKLYRNHKLYDEKNKPVYPSLLAMKNIIPKK